LACPQPRHVPPRRPSPRRLESGASTAAAAAAGTDREAQWKELRDGILMKYLMKLHAEREARLPDGSWRRISLSGSSPGSK
jgi:hypothetical protein